MAGNAEDFVMGFNLIPPPKGRPEIGLDAYGRAVWPDGSATPVQAD